MFEDVLIKSMVLGQYIFLYKIVIICRLSPHSIKYFTVNTYFILFLKETLLNFIILMNCHSLMCTSHGLFEKCKI